MIKTLTITVRWKPLLALDIIEKLQRQILEIVNEAPDI